MYENQSKVFDLYADIAEVEISQAGFITYGGTITLQDVLTGVEMDVPLKDISFTVSY
jgi:tryptophanase